MLHAVWYDEDTAGSQLHLISVVLHLVNTRNAGCTNTNCCHEDQIIISVSSMSCKNPILHILNWHRLHFMLTSAVSKVQQKEVVRISHQKWATGIQSNVLNVV